MPQEIHPLRRYTCLICQSQILKGQKFRSMIINGFQGVCCKNHSPAELKARILESKTPINHDFLTLKINCNQANAFTLDLHHNPIMKP